VLRPDAIDIELSRLSLVTYLQALDVDVGVAEASLASAAASGVVDNVITSAVTTPAPDDVDSECASDGTATSSAAGSGSDAESVSVSGSPSDDEDLLRGDVAAPLHFTDHLNGEGASGSSHGNSRTTKPTPWHTTASPLSEVAASASDATDASDASSPSQSPLIVSMPMCSHETAARMRTLMMTDLIEGRKLEYDTDVGLLHLFERAGGRVDVSMVEAALASHQGLVDADGTDDAGGSPGSSCVSNAALQNNLAVVQVCCCDSTLWAASLHGCVAAVRREACVLRGDCRRLQLRDHFFAFADTEDGTVYAYATFGRVFLERYVSSGSPLANLVLELLDVDRRYCRVTTVTGPCQ
jgi:hypothetical protein